MSKTSSSSPIQKKDEALTPSTQYTAANALKICRKYKFKVPTAENTLWRENAPSLIFSFFSNLCILHPSSDDKNRAYDELAARLDVGGVFQDNYMLYMQQTGAVQRGIE